MRRRDFLASGALPFLGASTHDAGFSSDLVSCIFLLLVGGPSHLDTWDMKPDAPSHIRSPFRPIRTNVPGIEISEIFPLMARHADKYSLIRSVHSDTFPVHDIGHQLMQTGRAFREEDFIHPNFGSVLHRLKGVQSIVLSKPIGHTGGNMPHGDTAGYLGKEFDPLVLSAQSRLGTESEKTLERYGQTKFGQNCLLARQLVESGVRFVTVNMFDTVFHQLTWDIHGTRPFSPMLCYRDVIGPMFDRAYSALLEDLHDRGLLSTTMVVAAGEFGRTPRINQSGGRDHWPGCWTVLMGGGPLKGGVVVGSSDATGAEPRDRPVTPMEIAATIYQGLGVDTSICLREGFPLVDQGVGSIHELFR